MTEIASSTPVPAHRGTERSVELALATALRRARWTIFWERLWPALATLATAAGLFLTISWLGVWLWLPPLGRAAAVLAFAVIALAAAAPFVIVRVPAIADGLRRLDHASGLRHRPATALVDALAVTPSDSYSLVLWNAHVERARAAAQTFKAGWPSPRVAGRDPYALRAPGPEGPPGAQGPTGPAGGSGSAIHFLHVGCSTSSRTVSCKEGERILNAMAFTPGGAIEYQDEHHLMFRPRRIPAVVALACIPE